MVWAAAAASIVLYLIPLAVVLAARSFRLRSPWEIALDIPLVVSVDLLSVLLLGFAMRLETATLLSRALWIMGGAGWLWRQRKLGGFFVRPGLRRDQALGVLVSVGLGVVISMTLSRTYQIWDRYWHLPLVSSLRGQRLPFANVYEPGGHLQYHYAGDAMAAMLQSLSFGSISSDMALAEAHDIAFAGIGAIVALLAAGVGRTHAVLLALAGPAVLLHGPVPLRGDAGNNAIPLHGYSYSNFLINSMRPHIALGGLLLVGFIRAIAVRLRASEIVSARRTFPTLCAASAALAITDEASLALVGIAAFAAWMVDGNVVAEHRSRGVLCFAALAVTVLLSRGLFVGLGGGPVESITWVDARIAGLMPGSRTNLYGRDGLIVLATDFFPFVVATIGLALTALSRRGRRFAGVLTFSIVPILLCFVAVTHVEINYTPSESVRFFVAPCLVAIVLGVLWLPGVPRASLASLAITSALIVPAALTLYWLADRAQGEVGSWTLRGPFERTKKGAYGLDCRTIAGSRLGDEPEVSYVDTAAWYRYAACRPIYAPGMPKPPWRVKIGCTGQVYPKTQLPDVQAMVPHDAVIPALCMVGVEGSDPVCSYAVANTSCTPSGRDFVRCALTSAARDELRRRDLNTAAWP